jgi:hypothetical protein
MQCKEGTRVEMERGEDQTEEKEIKHMRCGGRHCNRGYFDARVA